MSNSQELLLEALGKMKELLSHPEIISRDQNPFLEDIVSEIYLLSTKYAEKHNAGPSVGGGSEDILNQLKTKISLVETEVNSTLQKLKFLKDITPKP